MTRATRGQTKTTIPLLGSREALRVQPYMRVGQPRHGWVRDIHLRPGAYQRAVDIGCAGPMNRLHRSSTGANQT